MVSCVLTPALPRAGNPRLELVKSTGSCGPAGIANNACFSYRGNQLFLLGLPLTLPLSVIATIINFTRWAGFSVRKRLRSACLILCFLSAEVLVSLAGGIPKNSELFEPHRLSLNFHPPSDKPAMTQLFERDAA